MSATRSDRPRIWAQKDPSISSPQRGHARRMRKMPTDAERKLWSHRRHRLPLTSTHFRRQVRIGPSIADFACHRCKLVIEVDGGQHAQNASADQKRIDRFGADGYRVSRFWNNEALSNIDGALVEIQRARTTTPSPQGGGEK